MLELDYSWIEAFTSIGSYRAGDAIKWQITDFGKFRDDIIVCKWASPIKIDFALNSSSSSQTTNILVNHDYKIYT